AAVQAASARANRRDAVGGIPAGTRTVDLGDHRSAPRSQVFRGEVVLLVLAAVLFDMDGTLLDSEKVWDVALDDLAVWLGGTLSQTARQRMVGSSLARSIAIMHADLDVEADPESSGAYLLSRTEELFRTELVWKPGAKELLD